MFQLLDFVSVYLVTTVFCILYVESKLIFAWVSCSNFAFNCNMKSALGHFTLATTNKTSVISNVRLSCLQKIRPKGFHWKTWLHSSSYFSSPSLRTRSAYSILFSPPLQVDHPKFGRRLLLVIGLAGMLVTSVLLTVSITIYVCFILFS